MKRKVFRGYQIVVFVIVSVVIGNFAYYFPNMPPLIRNAIVKQRVDLRDNQLLGEEPDERFMEWFNRDPEREIPLEPRIIVSPADGFIDGIVEKNGRQHIIIEMRYTDVHVQRVPIAGRVVKIEGDGLKLPKGKLVGDYTLEKMMPYQKMTTMETDIGPVVVRQITSFFANRIQVFVNEGQAVERGVRLGRILAGSTIVLELPTEVEILVEQEENVFGGETILGKY